MNQADKEYFRLLNLVLKEGKTKKNRTGTNTLGVFGAQARFNLQYGFPAITTKKLYFDSVVHELLWFLSGSTNIKYLVDNNVHIWDDNCFDKYDKTPLDYLNKLETIRLENLPKPTCPEEDTLLNHRRKATKEEFINEIEIRSANHPFVQKWGNLGTGTYGGMWREFPYFIPKQNRHEGVTLTDYRDPKYDDNAVGYIDQINKVINKLKNNPDDRRMIVSAWHPYWVDHCALPPCHIMFQFHTEELTSFERSAAGKVPWTYLQSDDKEACEKFDYEMNTKRYDELNLPTRRLNCQLYQRSCDLFLGVPFNIASYSLLTCMIAKIVNMVPGEFIHTYGDLHIYENHLDQVKEQLSREPRDLPKLKLNPEIKNIFQFKFEDISLENYNPHPPIKAKMAV